MLEAIAIFFIISFSILGILAVGIVAIIIRILVKDEKEARHQC
jgi:hypothetical protein